MAEKYPVMSSAVPECYYEETRTENNVEQATFGAGCFWSVESFFREVPGVVDAVAGYAGGQTKSPTYRDVCTDRTGHAEVVQVTFNPEKVSYDQMLDIFFQNHDPTQLNRQGPDVGTQYRSVIFTHSPEQEYAARAKKEALTRQFNRPIVTSIEPVLAFWRAEEYHQRYLEKNGLPSCQVRVPDAS